MKALLIVMAVSALNLTGQEAPSANPHATAADQAAGAQIFRSHCAACHGVKGTGGLGANLTTGVFSHGGTPADIYRDINEGIPGTAMPSAFFDGVQVWQVVAYVQSLSQTGAGTAPVRGDSARGAQLFREKGCVGCHLARGEGGSNGPDLSVIGSQRSVDYLRQSILDPNAEVASQYWVAKITARGGVVYTGFIMNQDTYEVQILDFKRGLQAVSRSSIRNLSIDRNSSMPSFKGKLSDAEVDDLVSFLYSLKRPIVKE